MRIRTKDYCAKEGKKVNLNKWPTIAKPVYGSKSDYQKQLTKSVDKMIELQTLLYSTNRNAILIIFQGMDAAGKDGTIKHVMSGVNPQGCDVTSFKHPSAIELEHDFLWRPAKHLPERGKIGIFNRSYYEEVLITRVHPYILAAESLENDIHDTHDSEKLWKERYESINNFEKHLVRNGTRVIKFFLHLSYEEQRKRFLDRIDDPQKNWKLSEADLHERTYWKQYREAYETCLTETTTAIAPWHIVPADDKLSMRLIISQIITDAMDDFKMEHPRPNAQRIQELKSIRQQLTTHEKTKRE